MDLGIFPISHISQRLARVMANVGDYIYSPIGTMCLEFNGISIRQLATQVPSYSEMYFGRCLL